MSAWDVIGLCASIVLLGGIGTAFVVDWILKHRLELMQQLFERAVMQAESIDGALSQHGARIRSLDERVERLEEWKSKVAVELVELRGRTIPK